VSAAGDFDRLVADAHADSWQALGELFAGRGGGTATHHGLRLMASGLPDAAWNSGDVSAADADIEAARTFYESRGVPWGLRVPPWVRFRPGRRLTHQRLMGLRRPDFRAREAPAGLSLALASAADLEDVVRIDSEAFASDPAHGRPWLAALLGAPADVVAVALARSEGRAVGTGYAVSASSAAGSSVLIGGIAVIETQRERGIGGALSSWLVRHGFERARLAQLASDDDRAARLYARLGFVETAGHDIYIDF